MRSAKKIISTLLIVSLLVGCMFAFAACGEEETVATEKHKKAIIICTALTSGGLYDTTTGESVWDPLSEDVYFQQLLADGDMAGFIMGILTDTSIYSTAANILKYSTDEEKANNLIWQVTLDENGNSNNPNLKPANKDSGDDYAYTGDSKIQYGALAAYREQCLDLQNIYGDDYDVVVFNYDWRIDNRINSELLEQFVDTNKYEKIVLTSHSMGGPVVAGYLARSAENRAKVQAYFAYAPAYSGSGDAIYFLDDPVGCCYDTVRGVVDIDLSSILDDALNALAKPLIQNMTSVMQLLPSWDFLKSEYYDEDQSCIYVDGTPIRSKAELLAWYQSRPWAKKADGSLKPGMATLEAYWESLYVHDVDYNKDGQINEDDRVFAPQLVNTYYCLGSGYTTKKSFDFKSDGTTYDHSTGIKYGDGDGTMPINACLGGLSTSDIADGHLIIYAPADHGSVGCAWTSLMKEDFCRILDEYLAQEALKETPKS